MVGKELRFLCIVHHCLIQTVVYCLYYWEVSSAVVVPLLSRVSGAVFQF